MQSNASTAILVLSVALTAWPSVGHTSVVTGNPKVYEVDFDPEDSVPGGVWVDDCQSTALVWYPLQSGPSAGLASTTVSTEVCAAWLRVDHPSGSWSDLPLELPGQAAPFGVWTWLEESIWNRWLSLP